MFIALVVLGIAILLSGGVFAYGHYLAAQSVQKAAQIDVAQKSVSQDTVEGYLRVSNRLRSAETVLSGHVMLSQFFDLLESLTLSNVRLTSVSISMNEDRSADVKMTGVAKNFNALAAQSAAFANDARIKQAIFSGINADKNGVVTFSVTATLDSRLVLITNTVPVSWNVVANPVPATVVATTTASTSSEQSATTTP